MICAREGCNCLVTAQRGTPRYCSKKCQVNRKTVKVEGTRICVRDGCGNEIVGLRSDARFCSSQCRASYAMRRHNYGITDAEFVEQLADQGGVCAICNQVATKSNPWAVDHDHTCCTSRRSCGHCNRGILCVACNSGLGQFKDDSELLRRAANYVAMGGVWSAR